MMMSNHLDRPRAAVSGSRWLLLLLLNGSIAATAVAYLAFAPKVYESTFSVKPEDSQQKVTTNSNEQGVANISDNEQKSAAADLQDPAQVQKEVLLSNAVLASAAKQLQVTPRQMSDMLQARPVYKTSILQVALRASTPQKAQQSAQVMLDTYLARAQSLRRTELSTKKAAYKLALDDAGRRLGQTELQLARVRAQTGLLDDGTYFQETIRLSLALQQQRILAIGQLENTSAQADALALRIGTTANQAATGLRLSSYLPYKTARQDLDQVERQLTQNQAKFTDSNPKVAVLLEQQKALKKLVQQRQQEVLPGQQSTLAGLYGDDLGQGGSRSILLSQLISSKAQTQGLRAQLKAIDGQVQSLNTRIRSLPIAQQQVSEARRRFLISQGIFNNALAQYQSVLLTEMTLSSDVQIFDPPSLPYEAASPKPFVVAAGAGAVGVLATTALLLWFNRRRGGLVLQDDWLSRSAVGPQPQPQPQPAKPY